jgi:SNF family Na+-dependent transporter
MNFVIELTGTVSSLFNIMKLFNHLFCQGKLVSLLFVLIFSFWTFKSAITIMAGALQVLGRRRTNERRRNT